ncbi:MAG: hypothetical protein V4508_13055 [Pseudomonadota bacterium]
MKTLTIKDLARAEQLDRDAMAAVRGGMKLPYLFGNVNIAGKFDSSIHATQDVAQEQNVFNETADGSAFLSDLRVKNQTSQFGQNNIMVAK